MNNTQELHVIFGTGPVGRAIAHELTQKGKALRMVNRSGRGDIDSNIEVISGEAKNQDFARKAAEGASHVYFALNPAYHLWVQEFPAMQSSVLQAAIANNARLIAMENVYMYGDTDGKPLREDMPMKAHNKKGTLRANMAKELMAAHGAGKLRVVSGRASDFFGPGVKDSAMGERVFANAIQGKAAQIVGDANMPHTQTYMADIGKALVMLAENDSAYGQAWHIPSPRTLTQKEFLQMLYAQAGTEFKMMVAPKFLLRGMGLFIKPMGEMVEMLYEFEKPFILDDSKFKQAFGDIATPLETAIQRTLDWYRQQEAVRV